MPSCSSVFLLVALLGAIAHGRCLVPTNGASHLMTSQLETAGDAHGKGAVHAYQRSHSTRDLLSLENSVAVRTPSSVVQDWSLVCQQLCGAGLSGSRCAAHCSPHGVINANAASVLKSNEDLICQDLCKLQLGGVTCNCANADDAVLDHDHVTANEVCRIFCTHNGLTLNGCGLCGANMESIAAVETDDVHESLGQRAVRKDTHALPMVLRANPTTPSSSTPNWNELCAALCKTGDGGSLCNCDLSPFFR